MNNKFNSACFTGTIAVLLWEFIVALFAGYVPISSETPAGVYLLLVALFTFVAVCVSLSTVVSLTRYVSALVREDARKEQAAESTLQV